jgi:hypothetical protein
MLQNPDSFGAKLKRPKDMDEVARWKMLDVVQFLLGLGRSRSLVIADACLGPSEAYLSEESY